MRLSLSALILLVLNLIQSMAWTCHIVHHRQQSRHTASFTRCNSETESNDEIKPKAEFGVSYIGGDPCGSKYNNDPFDTNISKPGMPDDMKARIQALAEKKAKESKGMNKNE